MPVFSDHAACDAVPTLPADVIAAATSLTATAGNTAQFAQAATLAVTKCEWGRERGGKGRGREHMHAFKEVP